MVKKLLNYFLLIILLVIVGFTSPTPVAADHCSEWDLLHEWCIAVGVHPSAQSCPDDVTYCDNGRSIHKHGGTWRNDQCVYAFDDVGSCGTPVAPVVTTLPPLAQSCPDDVTYCDNGRSIHKHGGTWRNDQCVYAFDDVGSCASPAADRACPVDKTYCDNGRSIRQHAGKWGNLTDGTVGCTYKIDNVGPCASPAGQGGATTTPSVYTTHYRISESPSELEQADWTAYTSHPLKISHTFSDQTLGVKVLYVQFKNSNGEISSSSQANFTLTAPLSVELTGPSTSSVNSTVAVNASLNIPQGRSLKTASILVTKDGGSSGQLISDCPTQNRVGGVFCKIAETRSGVSLTANWTPSEAGNYLFIVQVEDSAYLNNPESNGLCASNPYVLYPYRFGDSGKFVKCGEDELGDAARVRVAVTAIGSDTDCSDGILVNGCFEQGSGNNITDWNCNGATSGTCAIQSGSVRVENTNTEPDWGYQLSQTLPDLTAGAQYCLSATAVTASAGSKLKVGLQNNSSDNNFPFEGSAGQARSDRRSFTASAPASGYAVYLRAESGAGSFDNVSLTQGACEAVAASCNANHLTLNWAEVSGSENYTIRANFLGDPAWNPQYTGSDCDSATSPGGTGDRACEAGNVTSKVVNIGSYAGDFNWTITSTNGQVQSFGPVRCGS